MAKRAESQEADRYHGFLSFQARGVVAFPAELRRRLHADTPGAQLEVIEREDGVFELRPTLPVPADQAWFWTEGWQRMEREADEDIAAGRLGRAVDVEEFLEHLRSRTS
jgi:bifunctional DNA-binding transcriptional regulator/antitoxin component of YhaV-PrlF toxin-antitoxin module